MRTNNSQVILDVATQIILLDTEHNPDYFKNAPLKVMFPYIKKIQQAMSKTYQVNYNAARELNEKTIEAFTQHAISGCSIAMRHGEQESAIEFIATLFVFKYLKDQFKIEFLIESSENQCALQPAQALAKLLKTDCKINSALACVNYPDNSLFSELLKQNQVRLMMTHTQKINAVCEAQKLPVSHFDYFGFLQSAYLVNSAKYSISS